MSLISPWMGILGTPLIWLAYLQISYALATTPCPRDMKGAIGIATAVALGATAVAAFACWRSWCASGAGHNTHNSDPLGLGRFLALSGLGVSGLILLLVIASAIPIIVVKGCE
jgi:hypothetical protein